MNSEKYRSHGQYLYRKYEPHFHHIFTTESYYILRELPQAILKNFFVDRIPELLEKQKKSGMWKNRDSERITFDILSAMAECKNDFTTEKDLKYDPYGFVEKKTDIYSVLIKKAFYPDNDPDIRLEVSKIVNDILKKQEKNGSWYSTVIGTAIEIDTLLLLGEDKARKEIKAGAGYLLSNLNEDQKGDHVGKPYGFTAHHMFSTHDRGKEHEAALKLKPEWIPRNICYRHLGVIQNSLCLNVMLKLGYEKQREIALALDNIKEIEEQWNGLCDSDIKKAYLLKNG
jgi:hypothetical protein